MYTVYISDKTLNCFENSEGKKRDKSTDGEEERDLDDIIRMELYDTTIKIKGMGPQAKLTAPEYQRNLLIVRFCLVYNPYAVPKAKPIRCTVNITLPDNRLFHLRRFMCLLFLYSTWESSRTHSFHLEPKQYYCRCIFHVPLY